MAVSVTPCRDDSTTHFSDGQTLGETVDLNIVVLCGRLSIEPEHRVFDSGAHLLRYLVVTRTEYPKRRTDVVAVTYWNPPGELLERPGEKGDRIWVCGSVQKRYWASSEGRRSNLEIVAEQVTLRDLEDLEPLVVDTTGHSERV